MHLLPGFLDPPDPDRALRVGAEATTYAGLLGAAGAVAASLDGRRRIAVHASPTLATATAVAGAVLAGVEVVPVPPDSGPAERAHLLADAAPDAWLGDPPEGRSDALPTIPFDTRARATHRPRDLQADGVALILYTSGTTGPPKGVLLPRRAIAACLDGLAEAWRWSADDVLAHGLPLFHVHGLVLGLLGPLRLGSGLAHTGRPTPAAYAEAVRERGATLLFGVPTVWSRIAADPEAAAALRPARLLVSGSAALPAPTLARLRSLTGHDVIERYGMSETLITVATHVGDPARPGTVGRPLPGVETRLRDEAGAVVPHDGASIGRLEVRGPTLGDGYLGLPEATAEAWTDDGWFHTGDVATIDADGVHRIVGRESTDLIKSGGYRIGAGEIETVLLGHEAVAECAVVGEPDPDLGQRIVAWVVPAAEVSGEELAAYVARELSAHKRPRAVHLVDALPRNEMGKVRKALLIGRSHE